MTAAHWIIVVLVPACFVLAVLAADYRAQARRYRRLYLDRKP